MREYIELVDRSGNNINLEALDLALLGSLSKLRRSCVPVGGFVLCMQRDYDPTDSEGQWVRALFIGRVVKREGPSSFRLTVDDLCEPERSLCDLDESMVFGPISNSQFQRAKQLGFKTDYKTLIEIIGDENGELAGLRELLKDGQKGKIHQFSAYTSEYRRC